MPASTRTTEPNPKLERLLIQASRDELEAVLREILNHEPYLIYPVIGALEVNPK